MTEKRGRQFNGWTSVNAYTFASLSLEAMLGEPFLFNDAIAVSLTP
jgi:hypothetical protein